MAEFILGLFFGSIVTLLAIKIFIEGASPLRANTEQPLVGPPDKSEERPAALARPESLSELKTYIEGVMLHYKSRYRPDQFDQGVVAACETILQRFGTSDQGPISQCASKISDGSADYVVSRVESGS